MQVEELAYKCRLQRTILLRPTSCFLSEGELMPKYLDKEIRVSGRRNHRRNNNSPQMGDEVLQSIMLRQLIEVSKQDFTIISELAGVYYYDCIYQLLLAQLRQII
jgi:hypothetical protein